MNLWSGDIKIEVENVVDKIQDSQNLPVEGWKRSEMQA